MWCLIRDWVQEDRAWSQTWFSSCKICDLLVLEIILLCKDVDSEIILRLPRQFRQTTQHCADPDHLCSHVLSSLSSAGYLNFTCLPNPSLPPCLSTTLSALLLLWPFCLKLLCGCCSALPVSPNPPTHHPPQHPSLVLWFNDSPQTFLYSLEANVLNEWTLSQSLTVNLSSTKF